MARGPDGQILNTPISREEERLNSMEYELTLGIEQVIDGAVADYHGGGPFAYGVHQALSPRMRDLLARRYRAAGWGDVCMTEGATGSSILVLHRDP